MRDVAIISAGMTRFGELWDSSLRDVFAEAALEAIGNAKADHLDAIYVGNMSAGGFVGQEHIGPLLADRIGLAGVPATRVESACASGGAALRCAFFEVASGASDLVMASGVEKMNDGADVTEVLAMAADQELEAYHGVTFPGLYAMIARAHMTAYGTTEEDLAWVSVKNHRHGALQPEGAVPPRGDAGAGDERVPRRRTATAAALLAGQRRGGRRASSAPWTRRTSTRTGRCGSWAAAWPPRP